MAWNILAVIFEKLDASIGGDKFTESMSADEITRAKNGIRDLPKLAGGNNPDAAMNTITVLQYSKALRFLTSALNIPQLTPELFLKAMADVDPGWKLQWGQYDAIFTVFPFTPGIRPDPADKTKQKYRSGGLTPGAYDPLILKGATWFSITGNYIPPDASQTYPYWDMSANSGEAYLHEWIHGSKGFFEAWGPYFGFATAVVGDADGAGTYGYVQDPKTGSWNKYYKDYMNGKVPKVGTNPGGGITSAMYKAAKPSDPLGWIGLGASSAALTQKYQAAYGLSPYKGLPARSSNGKVHTWGDGEIQDMFNSDGEFAIMAGSGRDVCVLGPNWWKKFLAVGGVGSVGYPMAAEHDWVCGRTIDFKTKSGAWSALMKASWLNDIVHLPTPWWNKFFAVGKAEVLGFPIGDVHAWGEGTLVDFQNASKTACALMMRDGGTDIYYVPSAFWSKYLAAGGAPGIGYPKGDVHTWGNGEVQDFELKNTWHAGIMRKQGSSAVFVVKGSLWKAYVGTAGNGATSYLGYPKGDEYEWTNPATKKKYQRQDFDGGWLWMNKIDSTYGNDKKLV